MKKLAGQRLTADSTRTATGSSRAMHGSVRSRRFVSRDSGMTASLQDGDASGDADGASERVRMHVRVRGTAA